MKCITIFEILMFASATLAVYPGTKDNKISNNNDKMGENSVETDESNPKYVVYEPVPCQMVFSRYGCCWDGKSIPKGPNGEGCPVCNDHPHMKCKNWKPLCKDRVVKEICPETCGVCAATKAGQNLNSKGECKDDPIWRKLCPVYKELNFCQKSDIARHCRKSCGKCK